MVASTINAHLPARRPTCWLGLGAEPWGAALWATTTWLSGWQDMVLPHILHGLAQVSVPDSISFQAEGLES